MNVDIAVIGAGPAGLAAANTAAAGGAASVLVIDSAAQPGGQFWRHRAEAAGRDDGRLHHGWDDYLALRTAFDASIATGVIDFRPATSAWMVTSHPDGFDLHLAPSHGVGRSLNPVVTATRLIIATGGYDRQIPIPGWDLPGVMAAGGIQGFAKQNGMLPGRRYVVAGTGPFLLPVAATVAQLGGEVAAVLESSQVTGWLPHVRAAAGVPGKALEGAGYAWTLLRHRIPYRTRTVVTEILGDDRVEAVRTARIDRLGAVVPGTETTIENIDAVGLGWGFTPQLELPVALGAGTRVDVDGSLVAVVDADQRSTVPGLFLAGEVTGVGGAVLAVAEGRVAGTIAAAEVVARDSGELGSAGGSESAAGTWRPGGSGSVSGTGPGAEPGSAGGSASVAGSWRPDGSGSGQGARQLSNPAPSIGPDLRAERGTIVRHRAFARAMHLAHPVPTGWEKRVAADTIVCRCEEVSAGEITHAREGLAAADARAQKSMTRAGMGWCQGRECGFAVACLAGADSASADSPSGSGVEQPGSEARPPLSAPADRESATALDGGSTPATASRRGSTPAAADRPSPTPLSQTMKRPVSQPVPLSEFFDL